MPDIPIRITTTGGDGAKAQISSVTQAAKALSDAAKSNADAYRQAIAAGKSHDEALRAIVQSSNQAASANRNVGQSAQAAASTANAATQSMATAWSPAIAAAREYEAQERRVGDAAQARSRLMNGLTVGAGATAIAANLITNKLIAVGAEAGNASVKLDAMLAVRGETGMRGQLDDLSTRLSKLTGWDDDLFTEAETRLQSFGVKGKDIIGGLLAGLTGQANTMGDGMQGVLAGAEQVGKALENINAGALTRSGTTLDPKDIKAIEDLKSGGHYDEARAMLLSKILDSYAKFAVKAGDGARQATKDIGNFHVAAGNVQEAVGQGAEEMRARWMNAFTPILDSLSKGHEGTLKFAGGIVEIGTQIGNIATPIVGGIRLFTEFNTMMKLSRIATALDGDAAAGSAIKYDLLTAAKARAAGIPAVAGVLAKGAGVVGTGIAVGAIGYEGLRAVGILDPEEHPDAMTAAGNASGRIGSILAGGLTTGHGIHEYDHLVQGQESEAMSKELTARNAAKRKLRTPGAGGAGVAAAAAYTAALDDGAPVPHSLHAGAQAAAQRRAQSEAHRNAEYGAGADAAELSDAGREKIAGLRYDSEGIQSRAKHELARQFREIRAQEKAGTLDKDAGSEKITQLKAAYEQRDKMREADLVAQIAQIEAETTVHEAQVKAAEESGAKAQAILRTAYSARNRILGEAARKVQSLRDEAADAGLDAAGKGTATKHFMPLLSQPGGNSGSMFDPYSNARPYADSTGSFISMIGAAATATNNISDVRQRPIPSLMGGTQAVGTGRELNSAPREISMIAAAAANGNISDVMQRPIPSLLGGTGLVGSGRELNPRPREIFLEHDVNVEVGVDGETVLVFREKRVSLPKDRSADAFR